MWQVEAVLLGVAEVKLPLRRLPVEEQRRVMNEIYFALTEPPGYEERSDEELRRRAVGVVDSFYAMQEVVVEGQSRQCVVLCHQDTILQFRLSDVMYADIVDDHHSQVVFVTRSENFGRAAVLLLMQSEATAKSIIEKLKQGMQRPTSGVCVNNRTSIKNGDDSDDNSKDVPKFMTRLTSFLSGTPIKAAEATPESSKRISLSFESSEENSASEETENEEDISDSISLPPEETELKQNRTTTPEELIEAEINYILENEKKYLNMLTSLEADRDELTKQSPPFIRKWLSQLFRQVRTLKTTHETLLASLVSAKYDIVKFCESFLDLKKQLYDYVFYIENIPVVDKLIVEYSSFLKERKPDLVDKLRQPRLRLTHYVLMFDSLKKKVQNDDGILLLEQATDVCKKYLKEADKSLLFRTIAGCPFHLSECGDLVHMSQLRLTSSPDIRSRLYYVVLLQRKLIITRGNEDQYHFVQSIPVDEMHVKDNARGLYFSIKVNRSDKGYSHVYQFKAKNIKIQQLWLRKLKETNENIQTLLVRNVGRASFGKSGKKVAKQLSMSNKTSSVQSNNIDSESDEESSKQYWINRRKEVKKFYSFNIREQRKSKAQLSGSLSDGEDQYSEHVRGMAPLTVWNFFQELEHLYKALRDSSFKGSANINMKTSSTSHLRAVEKKYVETLEKQVEKYQEKNNVNPPKEIKVIIRRLLLYHSRKVINKLEESTNIDESFLEALTQNGEEFAVLYRDFFIDRCTYHEEMMEMDLDDKCVAPIHHFSHYCRYVIQLRMEKVLNNGLIETVSRILHDTITTANNYLLVESINTVPFALSQCEPILMVGRLKMRSDGRSRQEYQVVLVRDQLIILEIKRPLYNYFSSLRMDSVCLGPSTSSRQFQIEYSTTASTKRVYWFYAAREEVRERWVTEILQILNEQAARLREEHNKRSENAPSLQVGPKPKDHHVAALHTVDVSRSPRFQKKMIKRHLMMETDL